MGPTNVALFKLFNADQQLRAGQARLDAAERNVRIQERRVADFNEKAKLSQVTVREQQSRARQFELDLASRDAHIEKLRTQQQNTHNNREYQAFLVEINTAKVDRNKVEEEAMRAIEAVDKGQKDAAVLQVQVDAERAKLVTMKAEVGETVARLKTEVEALRPARDAAAAAVPLKAREAFERLAEHHDGEAMSAISKPDRRREEYLCTACNMELARDVYNKLHSRDELVYCPSCRRILYIPEGLSVEEALGTAKPTVKRTRTATPRATKTKTRAATAAAGTTAAAEAPPATNGSEVVEIELRAKGKLGEALSKAQGETVQSAVKAGETPVECEVYVGGTLAGIYKGQSPEQLERAVRYYIRQAKLEGEVRVVEVQEPEAEPPESAAGPTAAPEASALVPETGGNGEPGPAEPSPTTAEAAAAPAEPPVPETAAAGGGPAGEGTSTDNQA